MDDEGVTRLRRVIGRLARQLNASSTGEGLTPSQSSVLSLIVSRGQLSLAELADLEGLNPTMLSRVLSKLQGMELITRIPDPADLRTASVTATAAGDRVHHRIKAQRAIVVSRCIKLLTASDRTALVSALPALESLAEELQRTSHMPPPGAI